MNSALFVLGTLFPIFCILALGAMLRATGFVTEPVAKGLNKLVFHIALPCLIVHSVAHSPMDDGWQGTALAIALATVAVFALSWFASPLLGISRASRPTFCQSAFRSNDVYIGLPVVLFAFAGHPAFETARSLALLTIAPCILLFNVLAVFILTKPGETGSPTRRVLSTLAGMFRNPLIVACLVGILLLILRERTGFSLPAPVDKTIQSLGAMATAGSLFALGASLTRERLAASLRGAHVCALMKLVAAPLFGVLFASIIGLSPVHRCVALLILACPSAVASFVMAQAMDGDADLAGSSVALTTIYSFFSLSSVLLFAMPH